jgi:hypothetical protein
LQVIIKGFTWVVLVEKLSLEAYKNFKSSSYLPYSYSFISACFSAHRLVFDRSKSYFINHICWLENFCVYTEISFHFLGVLQLISARFCLLIQQGSVISLKSLLHRAPGRLLGLHFSSLGNISPFLSYSYTIFWSL